MHMCIDVVWAIMRHLLPLELVVLSQTSRSWRQGIYCHQPQYHALLQSNELWMQSLVVHYMPSNWKEPKENRHPLGILKRAVIIDAMNLRDHPLDYPISKLHLGSQMIGVEWLPRVLHSVHITDYRFTDTSLFAACPAALTLSRCDLSVIPSDMWLTSSSRPYVSIHMHRVFLHGSSDITAVLLYRRGVLVAASRSDWYDSTSLDTVFCQAPRLYLYRATMSPVLQCHTLHVTCVTAPIHSPTVQCIYMNVSFHEINASALPQLKTIHINKSGQDLIGHQNLERVHFRGCLESPLIQNNPRLQDLTLDACQSPISIGPGNTCLESIESYQSEIEWTPSCETRQSIVTLPGAKWAVKPEYTLCDVHMALSIGNVMYSAFSDHIG